MRKFLTVILAIAVLLAFCCSQVSAAHTEKTISLDRFAKSRWQYLSRFSCGVGNCTLRFSIKANQPFSTLNSSATETNLSLVVFTEYTVGGAQEYEDVKEKYNRGFSRGGILVPHNGESSEIQERTFVQYVKTRVYFFYLADHEGNLQGKNFGKTQLKITLDTLNVDGGQLSEDEWGLKLPHLLMSLVFVVFFGLNLSKLKNYYHKEQELDYPFILLNAACFIEFLALFMEWIHLVILDSNGEGHFIPNFLSSTFSIFSQLTITSLLILIASGWSINYTQIEDLDLVALLGALLGFLHLLFIIFGHVHTDDPFKFHDYENWAGTILILAKIIFFGIFAYFLWNTAKQADYRVQKFIARFGLIGAAYLLTIPVVVFIASTFVDPYSRHKTVTVGNMLVQAVATLLLTFLLTSKKSPYYSISFKGKSGLPSLSGKMH